MIPTRKSPQPLQTSNRTSGCKPSPGRGRDVGHLIEVTVPGVFLTAVVGEVASEDEGSVSHERRSSGFEGREDRVVWPDKLGEVIVVGGVGLGGLVVIVCGWDGSSQVGGLVMLSLV